MIILESGTGNYVFSKGRKYSYFAGNNYLGLAGHAEVKDAAIRAVEKYGVNFSASRHTTGTSDLHLELETQLSEFMGKEDTVTFPSGYMGNGILMEMLKSRYTSVFYDESAHSSITGSIPSDIRQAVPYRHCDPDHLASLLSDCRENGKLIITDGIFALTGEIAPVDKICSLAMMHNATVIIDDAHATGILGSTGKGTAEHFQLNDNERIFQTGTMSKAFGCYGGFISIDKGLAGTIRNSSSIYKSSTALPPSVVASTLAALDIIRKSPGIRRSLIDKAAFIKESLTMMGFLTTPDPTPIIPVMFSSPDKAFNLSATLEDNGVIAPFVDYPVRSSKHIVRITLSAAHSDDQISELLQLMKKWKQRN